MGSSLVNEPIFRLIMPTCCVTLSGVRGKKDVGTIKRRFATFIIIYYSTMLSVNKLMPRIRVVVVLTAARLGSARA